MNSRYAILIFLTVVFIFSFNQFKEADSFYHLKTGQAIWEAKAIPQTDIFSFTAVGRPWVTHEWLAEVIFYLLAKISLWAVIFFIAGLSVATYFLLWLRSRLLGASAEWTVLALLVFGLLTFELWIPRPQVFSFFLAALLLLLLDSYRKTGRAKYITGLPILILLWANMHASFLLGLIIILFYAGYEQATKKPVRLLWLTFGSSLFLSFLNPNGFRIYTYAWDILPAVNALSILEWKSIVYFWSKPQVKVFLVMIFMTWGGLVYLRRSKIKEHALPILLISVAAILPLVAIRHVGFWPVIAAPLAAAALTESTKLREFAAGKNFRIGLIIFSVFLITVRLTQIDSRPINKLALPVQAADFAAKAGIKGPLFNFYNDGGYLIWRLWPGEKVFIDGRSEVYDEETVNDYKAITEVKDDWQALLEEKYGIDFVIFSYRNVLNYEASKRFAEGLLVENFALIYWDDTALIFVSDTQTNRSLIDKYALSHVEPFRDPEGIPLSEKKDALRELQILLDRQPESQVIRKYTELLLKNQ